MTTEGVLLDTTGMFGGLKPVNQGKVRDIYDVCEHLLIVSTDRLSAFDVIMNQGIPGKGKVLNEMSIRWMQRLSSASPHHFETASYNRYPEPFCQYAGILDGRSMLVSKQQTLPLEGVVRGYLAGSGLKEYLANGIVCGIPLPKNLKESDKLPDTIFTPATKAESGHDINLTHEQAIDHLENVLGISRATAVELFLKMQIRCTAMYLEAAEFACERGIIIADTKFELGIGDGEVRASMPLVLIDEILTPDSSRFWSLEDYEPGRSQKSFDKQPVRDYLESIGWDKRPPAPDLPAELVAETSRRYQDINTRLSN